MTINVRVYSQVLTKLGLVESVLPSDFQKPGNTLFISPIFFKPNFFAPKIFLQQKFFCDKKFFAPKFFCTKNFFRPRAIRYFLQAISLRIPSKCSQYLYNIACKYLHCNRDLQYIPQY